MPSSQQDLSQLIIPDDANQTKLNVFVSQLKEFGLPDDRIEAIAMSVATTATNQTMAKISALMSEGDWDNWKAFIDGEPTPNTAQQVITMNAYLKKRVGKELNDLYEEILDGVIKDIHKQVTETKDLQEKISQLSDDQVNQAKQLLEEGRYDEVDNIINNIQ